MVAWTIDLPEDTDRKLREYLAQDGRADALPRLIEEAVRHRTDRSLREVLEEVWAHNADVDPEVLQAEVDEAVSDVRADRS